MASTNPSAARLSRSTSDLAGANHQRTPGTSSSRVDGSKDTLPRAKIQALEQFVKFGRKGKQKEKEKSSQKTSEFPPPSWFESTPVSTSPPAAANPTSNTAARAVPHHDTPSPIVPPRTPPQLPPRPGYTGHATGLEPGKPTSDNALNTSRRANADIPTAPVASSEITRSRSLERRGSSFPSPGSPDGEDAANQEPLTLARRIQALLSLQSASTPSATDATTTSGAAQSEIAGPATPSGSMPPGPVPVSDSRFLALLGNTNVMSGSLDKGRQSVFAILDRLRRPSARATEAPAGSAITEEQDGDESEGDGSIMLYAPLVPSEDSEVEIAASDVMSVFDDGETLEYEEPARPLSFAEAGGQLTPRSPSRALSPEIPAKAEGPADASQSDAQKEPGTWFDTWKGKVIEGGKLVSDKVVEGTKSWKGKADGRKIVKTKTQWVPSPDKISFQVTWWGYRLYLPPPVLDVLNNKRLVAAKRAAIITTALQYLLGRVPISLVPPQFRAGFLVSQRLVPYLGYIGGFVAWSWGAIKSFDKGHGIVLTATWLLPVALIPGTWETKDAPRPPSPGADTGARST